MDKIGSEHDKESAAAPIRQNLKTASAEQLWHAALTPGANKFQSTTTLPELPIKCGVVKII